MQLGARARREAHRLNPQRPLDLSQFRAAAEQKLARAPPTQVSAQSADELLHELQVHQIELEMQNQALRQAQLDRDRYVDLYEFAPVGYLTLTDPGLIAEINLTGAALLGEDRRKLRDRRFAPFVVSEDQERWRRHFLHALRHGGKETCELGLQRSDGTVFDASLECLPKTAGVGSPVLRVTLTDITARKQAERTLRLTNDHLENLVEERTSQLAAALAEAEHANLAKSKFLAAASHDLRQPVQSLALLLAAIQEELAAKPKVAKAADMMEQALMGLRGLLNSILDVSRIDAGIVVPQLESIDVGGLVHRLCAKYQDQCRTKELTLRCRRVPGLHALADAALVERIMRNLIENAIRYTNRGGVVVSTRRHRDRLRIDVTDTGIGIAADKQVEIFEEFYQVNNPGRDRGQGLGLGLAIVARLARLLGGEVQVASRIGRGSRFSLLLPCNLDDGQGVEARSAPKLEVGGGRILIIEDDNLLRQCLPIMLERWGYEVLAAADGEDALDIAAREGWRFDAVIADYRLGPGLTGLATAKEIERRAGRSFPTVVVTSDTATSRIAELQGSGYAALHKPIAPDDLRRKLVELLRTTHPK